MSLTPKQTIKGTVAGAQSVRGAMKDIPPLDKTLTKDNYAADAKAVGEALETKAPISHTEDKGNPHGVTASQVGARPDTWMPSASEIGAAPASHAKDKNNPHGVTAEQVGARPNTWTPSAADVGAVPTTRKVNNKALSSDITLSASDVGARPNTWMPTPADIGAFNADNYLSSERNLSVGENVLALPNGVYSFEAWEGVTAEMAAQMNLPCVTWHYDFLVTSNHTVGASGKDTQLYKTILCFTSDGSIFKNNCAWEQWTGWKKILNSDTTPADIGAAPAGYGLGIGSVYSLKAIYSEEEAKAISETGWYGYHGPALSTGCNMGIIRAEIVSDIYKTLYFTDLNGYRLVNTLVYGAWTGWQWENPPMELGVEYCTTERYNGKLVYAQRVNFGALPDYSHKTIYVTAAGVTDVISYEARYATATSGAIVDGSGQVGSNYSINGNQIIFTISVPSNSSAYNAIVLLKYIK